MVSFRNQEEKGKPTGHKASCRIVIKRKISRRTLNLVEGGNPAKASPPGVGKGVGGCPLFKVGGRGQWGGGGIRALCGERQHQRTGKNGGDQKKLWLGKNPGGKKNLVA